MRRILGVALVFFAIGCIAALITAGIHPIRRSSVHHADTNQTKTSTKLHWSVVPSAVSLVAGIFLTILPSRRRTAV